MALIYGLLRDMGFIGKIDFIKDGGMREDIV
jgi:hypothetical protein